MSNDKDKALRERSKILIKSFKANQNLIREQLMKIKLADAKKKNQVTVKTVSFSDFPQVAFEKTQPKLKFRSKSESSLRQERKIECFSKLDDCKSSSSESDSETEIESDDLAGLIRFNELTILEKLKDKNETEFLKHIENKRQAFLKHDYSENDSDTNIVKMKRKSRKEQTSARKAKTEKREKRPKSVPSYLRPTEASQKMIREKSPKSQVNRDKIINKETPKSSQTFLKRNKPRNKPLLGLDFVLDSLKTKSSTIIRGKNQKPEEYWQELCHFREENKNECFSSKPINFDGTTSSLFLDQSNFNEYFKQTDNELEDGINHRCIHSFTLNERLFPVPVYKDKNGQSICPVCKSTKKSEGSFFAPQFCKVSIPNYRLIEPISIQPCRKSNPRTEDTLSLAEHCVAGYQNAPKKSVNSYQTPPAKNIDLKSSTINFKEIYMNKPLTSVDLKLIEENRDPATAGIYSKANAMRYELEDQHLKRLRELIPKS